MNPDDPNTNDSLESKSKRYPSMLAMLAAAMFGGLPGNFGRRDKPIERAKKSKHQATKRAFKHIHAPKWNVVSKRRPSVIPTQHQRVVKGRAERAGLTVDEYISMVSELQLKVDSRRSA